MIYIQYHQYTNSPNIVHLHERYIITRNVLIATRLSTANGI